MNRSRFNEEQINPILKEQESGMPAAEACRRHGISSATFYQSKSKFGRLDVCKARRLQELESEDAKLKRLLADTMLDNSMPCPSPMASGTVRQRGFSRRSAGWPAPGWSCEPDLAVSGWRRQVGHAVRKFHRLDRRLTVARALSCVSSSMNAATESRLLMFRLCPARIEAVESKSSRHVIGRKAVDALGIEHAALDTLGHFRAEQFNHRGVSSSQLGR